MSNKLDIAKNDDAGGRDKKADRDLAVGPTRKRRHRQTLNTTGHTEPADRTVDEVLSVSNRLARSEPPVTIFDHDAVLKQLRLATSTGDYIGEYDLPVAPASSSDEQVRLDRLRALAADDPRRPLVAGDESLRDRLAQLRLECPAFVDAITIIEHAAALSVMTGFGITTPPMLLVGPPGLGKTHFSKRLAATLGVEQHSFSCATNSDAQALLIGHPATWRGGRMGVATEAIVGSETANPLIVLDEVDKFVTHATEKPYYSLLTLLEPENASSLVDEYLRIPFDLSRCLIIATANDIDSLPDFIRDRFLIVEIQLPSGDMLLTIARRIADDAIARYGNVFDRPEESVIAQLAKANPRTIRRTIGLALGCAATDGRRYLSVSDVTAAQACTMSCVPSRTIGFLGSRHDLRSQPPRCRSTDNKF